MYFYLYSFFNQLRRYAYRTWFGFSISVLLVLIGCQKSYVIMNHNEIRLGYSSGEVEYIPSLKRVIEEENRDLANHAMFQLGNIYYRLVTDKGYFNYNDNDNSDREVERNIIELEEFFVSNLNISTDFNLKNHIYRNLIFFPHSKTEDIYLNEVLNIPAGSESGSPDHDGKIENVMAVLKLVGKRLYYYPEADFDTLIEICTTGFQSDNERAKAVSVECLRDLKISVREADLTEQKIVELVGRVDNISMSLASNVGEGIYEKYLATRLMGVVNVE